MQALILTLTWSYFYRCLSEIDAIFAHASKVMPLVHSVVNNLDCAILFIILWDFYGYNLMTLSLKGTIKYEIGEK